MAIFIISAALVAMAAGCTYVAVTQPCQNGFHRHRHSRFRRFRPGGCSAVE